jgi:hypothetical protein
LAFDHIQGGGTKHQRQVGRGSGMLAWIIRNDYPPLFRVLCHNCNQAESTYGACPHRTVLRPAVDA